MLDNQSQAVLDESITLDPKNSILTDDTELKIHPLDLSGFNGLTSSDVMSMTSIPVLTTSQISAIGTTYTIGTSGTGTSFNWTGPNAWTTGTTIGTKIDHDGQISLQGKNADILVNDKSLMETLERIEQRLNLLQINSELEAEWDELRELGERYRALEKHCKEKAETWKKLNAMPPPIVD